MPLMTADEYKKYKVKQLRVLLYDHDLEIPGTERNKDYYATTAASLNLERADVIAFFDQHKNDNDKKMKRGERLKGRKRPNKKIVAKDAENEDNDDSDADSDDLGADVLTQDDPRAPDQDTPSTAPQHDANQLVQSTINYDVATMFTTPSTSEPPTTPFIHPNPPIPESLIAAILFKREEWATAFAVVDKPDISSGLEEELDALEKQAREINRQQFDALKWSDPDGYGHKYPFDYHRAYKREA
jgi:hypothetical protein